jgi:hypothetical protein
MTTQKNRNHHSNKSSLARKNHRLLQNILLARENEFIVVFDGPEREAEGMAGHSH